MGETVAQASKQCHQTEVPTLDPPERAGPLPPMAQCSLFRVPNYRTNVVRTQWWRDPRRPCLDPAGCAVRRVVVLCC